MHDLGVSVWEGVFCVLLCDLFLMIHNFLENVFMTSPFELGLTMSGCLSVVSSALLLIGGVQGQVVQCMRLQIACASMWFCQCFQCYDLQLLVPMIFPRPNFYNGSCALVHGTVLKFRFGVRSQTVILVSQHCHDD